MDDSVARTYGGRVRVRVCGVCWRNDDLLLVNHRGITATDFWAPPGGGVGFGETLEQRLRQELAEETGLNVSVERFLFGCELIEHPLHSIELFYSVKVDSGELKTGTDPELDIIAGVGFFSAQQIARIPRHELHGIFRLVESPADLRSLNGFFRI